MRVKSLWINDMGVLKDFSLTFPEQQNKYFGNLSVSIIVGENGTGKTSILRFLSQVFLGPKVGKNLPKQYKVDYEIPEADIDKYQSIDQMKQSSDLPSAVVVSSYSSFEQFQHVGPNRLYSKVQYNYIGTRSKSTYGKILTSFSSVYFPILNTYFSKTKSANALRKLVKNIGFDSPMVELGALQIQMSEGQKNTNKKFSKKVDKLNKFHMELYQKYKSKIFPIEDLEKYPGGGLKWIEHMRELKMWRGKNPFTNIWFYKRGEKVSLSNLSSGEISLFFRFFKLLEVVQDNSLILIDEPETHLHPKWQLKYIDMLSQVFWEYNSHIIIATHSPLIAADLPRNCIVGLKVDEELNVVKQHSIEEKTMGASTEDIMKEVFGVSSKFGEFTLRVMDEIRSYISSGNLRDARKLFRDLSDSEEKFSIFMLMREREKNEDVENK